MAPRGAIFYYSRVASVIVTAMLDDDHPVMMVPAVIAMFAKLGMCPEVTMAAFPDHDGLGAGNRRSRDRNRAQCCNNVTKLLHDVLLG
jgi:hypothetical protein